MQEKRVNLTVVKMNTANGLLHFKYGFQYLKYKFPTTAEAKDERMHIYWFAELISNPTFEKFE